jgi:hypothetical protein
VPKRDILIVTGLEHEAFFMESIILGRCYFPAVVVSVEIIALCKVE